MRAKSATKEIFPLSKNDQTFDVKVAGKYKFLVTGKSFVHLRSFVLFKRSEV